MMNDPIYDEILRIKRVLASQFGNDLDRIVADIKSRERNTVTLEPRVFPTQTSGRFQVALANLVITWRLFVR